MNWTIRTATRDDADALTALAHAAKARWKYPAAWMDAWHAALTITPDYIDDHTLLVAVANDATHSPLGMCALEDHGDHWRLEHVWVAPSAQGAGVGRALVLQALDDARRRGPERPIRLDADPQAAGFYRRLGGREVGSVAAPMDGAPNRVLPVFEF